MEQHRIGPAELRAGLATLLLAAALVVAPLVQAADANLSPEQQVLQLVNQARAAAGLAPLRNNAKLATAARDHSRDMANRNYFSHTDKSGRSAGQRITAQGYRWNT